MNISFNWQQLKKAIGYKHTRSQMALMGTEDGRLVEAELEVATACILKHSTRDGFILDAANQFRSREDGHYYQLISERSTLPICLINPSNIPNLKKLMNSLFSNTFWMDLLELSKEESRATIITGFIVIICISIIAFFGMAIYAYLQTGKVF